MLAFPAVVFGLVLLQSRRLWHVAKNFGILVLMFAVVLSPWVVRNFLTFRDFVPGSTLLGINLFMNSYYLDSPNYLEWLTPLTTIEAKMEQILNNRGDSLTNYDELGRDRLYTQEALRRIALRPDRYFLLSAHRFLRLWFNLGYGEAPSVRSWLVAGMNVTLFALAVVGSILEPRVRARWAILIWATILYFTIVHTLVQAYLRHIFPVIPLVILLAARSIYGGLRQVLEVIAHLANRSRSTHSHLKAQR